MSHEKKVLQWKNLKETFQKVKMPVLRLRYRLVLYGFTIVFIVLSLIQAACEKFDDMAGIAFYTLAAFTLAASSYYLVLDIRYGVREKIRQEIAENPFASRMVGDYRYRTLMFAVPGLTLNMIFAIFNGMTGFGVCLMVLGTGVHSICLAKKMKRNG